MREDARIPPEGAGSRSLFAGIPPPAQLRLTFTTSLLSSVHTRDLPSTRWFRGPHLLPLVEGSYQKET